MAHGFEPVIASDGVALKLLEKEFPYLKQVTLASYAITYAKKGAFFKLKLLRDTPQILKTIKAENKQLKAIIDAYGISGVISDNRLGLYNSAIPCVFITHQLKVLSGSTTWLSTKLHNRFIRKFNACWVPDTAETPNLSGALSHSTIPKITTHYIGPISRFNKYDGTPRIDVLVLLSGPEPQRSFLEDKLFKELKSYSGTIVFVRGVMAQEQTVEIRGNMTIYNFMTSALLEKTINDSRLILSRSGYTTVMDLAKLEKNAFFIPTPGQTEQEYLAKRLTKLGFVASCKQKNFKLELLDSVSNFKGLKAFNVPVDFETLFKPFRA